MFEFILPVNNIFPKPTIVLLSLFDLLKEYDFLRNYLLTVTTIYLSLFIAYYSVWLLFPLIIRQNFFSALILSFDRFFKYLPGIILAMILIIWVPNSEYSVIIFAFLISFNSLIYVSKASEESLDFSYYDMVKTFDIEEITIARKVLWRAIQPNLIKHIYNLNIYLWTSVIIFELINQKAGIGKVLRQILYYNDLSALIMCFIIIGSSIFISALLLNFTKRKFFFWEVEVQ